MSAANPSGIAGIDVHAVEAAIQDAGGLGPLMSGSPVPETQETATEGQGTTGSPGQLRDPVTGRWVTPGHEVSAPPAQETQQSEATDAFTNIDPASLPAELQPTYKSLQADYTRKTQEVAGLRKLSEQLGGQDNILEAARLYQSLQNPAYWPQLYGELKEGMEQLGLTPEQAAQVAGEQVAQQAAQQTNSQFDWSDPDLAPIKAEFDAMKSQLSEVTTSLTQRAESEKQERLQMALLGEMQRQESTIRQMNPGYTDEDVNSIYELSSYYQGNLLDAQKRYEDIVTSRLERFLAQKQQAVGTAGVGPVSGAGTLSQEPQHFDSLDDAHKAAMESLRQMGAAE